MPRSQPALSGLAVEPDLDHLLRALAGSPRHGPAIAHAATVPAVAARGGPWPDGVSAAVATACAGRGIHSLYAHQSQAIASALGGRHVVVATGTASGKSLCTLIPIFEALARDGAARALCLYPTKALAHDQLSALDGWRDLLPFPIPAATYDGDTPTSRRSAVRDNARIVLTNPDMLHAGILPHHPRWEPLFANLKFVVLDELHVYRGVFGSHVANVLRRLRRIAAHYGAQPQVLMTSATLANARQLGEQLAGGPPDVIADDAAEHGKRSFVFYNPPVVDPVLNQRRSSLLEAEALARHFIQGGVQTIVFARTRASTELIVRYIADALPEAADHVRGYRGGYTATERRAIEADLRSGRARCIVATNALELGIDIGQLDAVVMAGYPGTVASTWQQAGRVGRRSGHSVAVLVAAATPLDQFVVRNPEFILGGAPEQARIDPDNLLILLSHVRCAAFELPFGPNEAGQPFGEPRRGFGEPGAEQAVSPAEAAGGSAVSPTPANGPAVPRRGQAPAVAELLAVLEAQGVVQHHSDAWFWMADAYPAEAVSLRTTGADEVAIIVRAGEGEDVLGTVERASAPLMVHPGAVYMHAGQTYLVDRLDWEAGRAYVAPTDGALYTRASSTSSMTPLRLDAERNAWGARVACGELEVRSRATAYRKIRFRTHETIGWGEIDLPEQTYVAGGYWFTLDDHATAALELSGDLYVDLTGDRGPTWAKARDAARARDGFRCRRCGAPERPDRQHDVHHLQPYATFREASGAVRHESANGLDNLVSLCRPCHRSVERETGMQGTLSGLGYALSHMASLYLMCDPRDLRVSAQVHAPWTLRPTVALYESAMAGVGFGPALFELHEELLGAAFRLISGCMCREGCPACVGVPDETGPNARTRTLRILAALGVGPQGAFRDRTGSTP